MSNLLAGQQFEAGYGVSTVLADMDFETYSEAGYVWNEEKQRWDAPRGCGPATKGIGAVGAWVYAEHPSLEVLCLSYNLKDGSGPKRWHPWDAPPVDLFNHIAKGFLIEAHNSSFEWMIWNRHCVPKLGWPPLPFWQLRDSAAKALRWALPESLKDVAKALGSPDKDAEGQQIMRKLCCPRKPTKHDARKRYTIYDEPELFQKLYAYCDQDIVAEEGISIRIPDQSPQEMELWLVDQAINIRGVYIDLDLVNACIDMYEGVAVALNNELAMITEGRVSSASKVQDLKHWIAYRGFLIRSLAADAMSEALACDELPPDVRRALEIRESLSQSNVKKLYTLLRMTGSDSRMHYMLRYCGAERTGRWAGRGPQPQNISSGGPSVKKCKYGHVHHAQWTDCPTCLDNERKSVDWGIDGMEQLISDIHTYQGDWQEIQKWWGDPVKAISGLVRGCFTAAPGRDLICSDYTAIEAVVLAALAGEEWRLEVFRTHGMIYEMSASKISGVPFDEFKRHKAEFGEHHPLRKKVGKVAELASGYQGWIGAWKQFGADKFMTDDEIKENVLKWREESPMIAAFWKGVENAALAAIFSPGTYQTYRDVTYAVKGTCLYCRLPSGTILTYHHPKATKGLTPWGKEKWDITYWGYNRDATKGVIGWAERSTYGGSLTENIVQAVSRDLLAFALVNLEKAGYPVVMHVHDEVISEVLEGTGSVEEFEQIMSRTPPWAAGWPVKAQGGWRGKRYRKE